MAVLNYLIKLTRRPVPGFYRTSSRSNGRLIAINERERLPLFNFHY